MCWKRVSVKSSQMAAVVPLPATVCIIFSFLFHSIRQSKCDITIITTEIYSTRVSCSGAYLYAKRRICWNVSLLGKKQLLFLHALMVQLKELSLASVCTAFLIYTPVLAHSFLTWWVHSGCLGDPLTCFPLQSGRPRFDRPYLCCKNELGSRAVHGLFREQTSEAGLRQSLQHSRPWAITTPSSTASQPGWKDATERKLNILSLFRAVYT